MTVTIDNIARVANVSPSTVSRALSDRSLPVHPETRSRILKIAEDLDYMPSAAARRVAARSMAGIGLYWNHGRMIPSPSLLPFLMGVTPLLNQRRYNLLLTFTAFGDDARPRIIDERHVDGMIIGFDQDAPVMERLRRNRIPVVLTHAQLRADVDCVTVDDEGAARKCVDYLWHIGHRRIGYINTVLHHHISVQDRSLGFVKAMAEHGLQCQRGYDEPKPVPDRVDELYSGRDAPTALICYDDELAVHAKRLLASRGLTVPGDVSLIGFNDSAFARGSDIPMTSVRLPMEALGRTATEVLLRRVETPDRPFEQVRLEEELIVRGSTVAIG